MYRAALREYILAMGKAFHDHPTVIAWQLGNEQEGAVTRLCYNPACENAWKEWLRKTYGTPDEFNRRLNLVSWGMKVRSLEEVPQPGEGVEESATAIAALSLAHRHFRRDVLLDFFALQAGALREAGVTQWIITDWNTGWDAVADDPQAATTMDIAGLNYYQPWADNAQFWQDLSWHQDMHRSAYGRQHFLTTENRFGVMGGTAIWDPFPSREQFRMYGLQAAALGTCGLFYWSGNRWRGGHWPHWGGLFDWTGRPEPDFAWAIELGEIFQKWGKHLIANPVKPMAVVLTDFEQRAALEIYPHVKGSNAVLRESFDALHRLGIGADSMNLPTAAAQGKLAKYSLAVVPAATALDDQRVASELLEFAQAGGTVVITPFTAYMDENGVFRGDGFGANLHELTGGLVKTIRWMGLEPAGERKDPEVAWQGGGVTGDSPVGIEGYCEFLEVDLGTEIIATFRSRQPILNGRPAATRRTFGRGTVIKLAFWPADDSFLRLIRALALDRQTLLAAPLPLGVLAVPHTDDSLFIVNTTRQEQAVQLTRSAQDRLSTAVLNGTGKLSAFQVVWLEA
jgi:beta-galactosidase